MSYVKSIILLILLSGLVTLIVDSLPAMDQHYNQSSTNSEEPVDGHLLKKDLRNCQDIFHHCVNNEDCLNNLICRFVEINCSYKCMPESENKSVQMLYTTSAAEAEFKYQTPVIRKIKRDKSEISDTELIVGLSVLCLFISIGICANLCVNLCANVQCKCKRVINVECKYKREENIEIIEMRDINNNII